MFLYIFHSKFVFWSQSYQPLIFFVFQFLLLSLKATPLENFKKGTPTLMTPLNFFKKWTPHTQFLAVLGMMESMS